MNGVRSLSPALFTLHNFSFFSLHCPLFSLRIFSKNGYLFIGYRVRVLENEQGRTREEGGGVKTWESWAKILF